MTEVSPSHHHQQQQQQQIYRETRSSKGKEMVKTIPPSPALSQAEMPVHGLPSSHLNDYLQQQQHHTSAVFYPQDQQVSMESIHPQSQPGTRYNTPTPRSLYQPTAHPLVPQYPPPYSYPQPPQYDHSPFAFTEDYNTASSQPYSTPATSPPTPTRNTEVRVTRNGAYPRGGKAAAAAPQRSPPTAAATSSSPPPPATKKKAAAKDRGGKAAKKSPHLSGPMSEITRDSRIPVVDIAAYVNRSADERVAEVATGKVPGKIKRPMNAFMLYRKAYQERAKEWCNQHNHQVVSQVCGDSWPLEPDHVRAQFTEWAKIERDNHQRAHPSYKFTPAKPQKAKAAAAAAVLSASKRRLDTPGGTDDGDDPNDPDWRGSHNKRVRRNDTPLDEAEYQHHQQNPRPYYGGYQQQQQPPQHNRSAFHASNPGKPPPQPYDAHAAAGGGHYYQTMQVREGDVEHVLYKKTPSPAMLHHQQQQQQHGYGGGYDLSGYAPQHMSHHQQPQYLDAHHLQVVQQQQQHVLYAPPPPPHQRVLDPSLLPPGGAEQLLEDFSGYAAGGAYPHQLDPAHPSGPWNDGHHPQDTYVDHHQQTTTLEFGAGGGLGPYSNYVLPPGDAGPGAFGGDPGALLLVQPLPEEQTLDQEKIFRRDPWLRLDVGSPGAAEGEEWEDFGEGLGKVEGEGT